MTEEQLESLFQYSHLPSHLANASQKFYFMAGDIHAAYANTAEGTLALRKLWEVKNLVVWLAATQNHDDPQE